VITQGRNDAGRMENARRPWIFIQGRARSDLLFTMSDNTRTSRADPGRARNSCNLMDERARKRADMRARYMQQYATPMMCNIRITSIDRRSGGARRDRTDDLLLAKQALSQLSYGPFRDQWSVISNQEKAADY
jgi:hypothetical protein